MAELLGLGLSHYPPFAGRDEDMAGILRWTLEDPDIPAEAKDEANWPPEMRAEWGSDQGRASAAAHRSQLLAGFKKVRAVLDAFAPDVIVIWGDDQYENFQEDLIPPLAILAYPDLELRPWSEAKASSNMVGKQNYWQESANTVFNVNGHEELGRYLATSLLEQDIDVSYAYRQLHHRGLPHAYLNAVLYLDYHRVGFPYPVVPFSVNCYGRRVVSHRGYVSRFADLRPPDPPSPSPKRMMQVGAATARALASSPWRVALIASSSWSHAFICDKTWRLRPDTESDRMLYDAMIANEYRVWQDRTLGEVEDAGQQEMLNWFALIGAMHEIGHKVVWSDLVETHIFNSNKVFAAFGTDRQ